MTQMAARTGDYDDHRPALFVGTVDGDVLRAASRADLLAALGDDLYWYCRRVNDWGIVGDCTSEKRRKDHPRCHWAVKP